MKRFGYGIVAGIALAGAIAQAQDSLVGTYTGAYSASSPTGNTRQNGVKLVIDSAENGVVRGTATLDTGGPCSGNYAMAGKLAGGRLVMRSTRQSGAAGDCPFGLNVAMEGNKLVGSTGGGYPIQLSK